LGKGYGRLKDRGALFYAKADGSHVEEMVFPVETANGVGLSPDEDFVYVAETQGARLWRWQLDGPGQGWLAVGAPVRKTLSPHLPDTAFSTQWLSRPMAQYASPQL
jgi:sugar lactone lactonase YvrE